MEWSHIKYFLVMARVGTLLGAAKELKLSQPTLSRHLTALEDALGTAVFTRHKKGLVLTAAGEELKRHAEGMAENAMAIERIAMGADMALSGPVTITVVDSIGSEWLTQNLAPFRAIYPDIDLTLRIEESSADLMRKEADIAVRMYRPEQPDLIAKKVGLMEYGLFASQSYLDRVGRPQSLAEVENHQMVIPAGNYQHLLQPILKELNIKLGRRSFSANSSVALVTATLNGFGIGIHSSFSALTHQALIPLFPQAFYSSDIWLVTHEDIHRSARIRAAFDYLSDLFASYMKAMDAYKKEWCKAQLSGK